MKALRVLLTTLLVAALLTGTAYGAGIAYRYYEDQQGSQESATPIGGESDDLSTEAPSPTPAPVPDPEPAPQPPPNVLEPGDRGDQVRELQHRLFQLSWFPEKPTGVYDAATRDAVSGFQTKRGFDHTGVVDRRTWHRLLTMTRKPTHDEMYYILHPGPTLLGRSASGDDVRDLQARLKAIAWYFGDVTGTYDDQTVEAVRGFQAKREIPVTGEVDQRTLDRLHAMTYTPTYDAMHNIEPKPGALDPRCKTGRTLCIDKTSRTLRWVVDGTVLKTLDVRFGAEYTPTREGVFSVYWKDIDHVSELYGSEMPYSMFFSRGQAVHYSSDFAARGYYGASHGCVNVRDYDGLAWLFGQVRVGDKVVVYWS